MKGITDLWQRKKGGEQGQKAAEKKSRGGGRDLATAAFRHVTFLLTSGCNTHNSCYHLLPEVSLSFYIHTNSQS